MELPEVTLTRTTKALVIADDLMDRIADQALLGDAELLNDLSEALYNVVTAARVMEDLDDD